MIFVIGGVHQGKLDYTLKLTKFNNEDVIDCLNIGSLKIDEVLTDNRPVVYKFNILKNNRKSVIISNEIGYGIVPIDKFERRYRELTGRICCQVAKESEEVHRVICGIGTVIKGDRNDKNSFDKTL